MWIHPRSIGAALIVVLGCASAVGAFAQHEQGTGPSSSENRSPASESSTNAADREDRLSASELLVLIERKLAEDGIELQAWSTTLGVFEDETGEFILRLTPPEESCEVTRKLGRFESISDDQARELTNFIWSLLREIESCVTEPLPVTQREMLLTAVGSSQDWIGAMYVVGPITGSVGILGMAALVWTNDHDPGSVIGFRSLTPAMLTTTTAIFALGGFGSLLITEDYREVLVESSLITGSGTFLAAILEENAYRTVYAPLSGGAVASGLLVGINGLIRRPPHRRLREHYQRHAFSANTRMSGAEMKAVEDDLLRSESPISNWILYAPLFAGSAASITLGVIESESGDGIGLGEGLLPGLVGIGVGLIFALQPEGREFSRYQGVREERGFQRIRMGAGPGDRGGLSVYGLF
jgi:hypothetical protein